MPASQISELLDSWGRGDRDALKVLLPLIYKDLRLRARLQLKNERSDISWKGTELVHELYFNLARMPPIQWKNRDQFYAFAVHRMRQILVDHARHKFREKRGGGMIAVPLDEIEHGTERNELNVPLPGLHRALRELEAGNPRQGQIVELRCFGGYSINEISRMLQLSPTTIKREWAEALAWLRKRLD